MDEGAAMPEKAEEKAKRREYWRVYGPKHRAQKNAYMKEYYRQNRERCIKSAVEYQRRKFAESEGFRQRVRDDCRKWRERAKAYDILRKTIASWHRAGGTRSQEARRERFSSLFEKCTESQKARIAALLEKYEISL